MTIFFHWASVHCVQVVGWVLFAGLGCLLVCVRRIPFSAAYVKHISHIPVLDTRIGFGVAERSAMVTALGEQGRRHHAYFQIADIGFILVYVVALPGGLFTLFGSAIPAMVPVAGAVADLVEDSAILVALQKFPKPARPALAVAGVAGTVKHLCFWPSLIVVVAGGGFVLIRRLFDV